MGKDPWGEDVPVYKCVPLKITRGPPSQRKRALFWARVTRASGGRAAAAAAAATSFEALGEEEEEEDWVGMHVVHHLHRPMQRKICAATDRQAGMPLPSRPAACPPAHMRRMMRSFPSTRQTPCPSMKTRTVREACRWRQVPTRPQVRPRNARPHPRSLTHSTRTSKACVLIGARRALQRVPNMPRTMLV